MIKRTSLEHINSILQQNTNWNILDIGCGYTAHPKATIICDVQNLADYYPDKKFIQLTEKDVVRHRLVKDIIKAYSKDERKK